MNGMSDEPKSCPFCGGMTGYYETAVETHRYLYGWDGEPKGEGEPKEHKRNYVTRCIDCERKVDEYVTIEDEEDEW